MSNLFVLVLSKLGWFLWNYDQIMIKMLIILRVIPHVLISERDFAAVADLG